MQKKKPPNKNKQSESLLRVTQSLFHRLKFMFQHVLQRCFYLLVSPLQNVIKGKGRCKTKPKRDEPKLRHKETQGNHKETHTTLWDDATWNRWRLWHKYTEGNERHWSTRGTQLRTIIHDKTGRTRKWIYWHKTYLQRNTGSTTDTYKHRPHYDSRGNTGTWDQGRHRDTDMTQAL